MRRSLNPQHIMVRGNPGDPTGQLTVADHVFPAQLGRTGVLGAGISPAEGDGATPTGTFSMHQLYYRPDRRARPCTSLPVIPLRRDDLWCDDPAHALYNRPVHAPFPGRAESMWLPTRSYDICIVLGFNLAQPVPGAGSAIFFHLTRADIDPPPTEGCVAVHPEYMERILPLLGVGSTLTVALA